MIRPEKDSDYEAHAMHSLGEYATPYTLIEASVDTKSFGAGFEAWFSNNSRFRFDCRPNCSEKHGYIHAENWDHYAEYQKHSNCGPQIDFETEYAEYECGRSETDSEKMEKKKRQWCSRCFVICLVLILSGKR